jgi:hypothetical protein
MRELKPLEINCNLVNIPEEVEKVEVSNFSKYWKEELIDNLDYFRDIDATLYLPPESKVAFVYYFEYKGGVCKVSALTLKVFFLNKPGNKWIKYSKGEKLASILLDIENKVIQNEVSKGVCKIDLTLCKSQSDRITEKQFFYATKLLEESGKSYVPRELEVINKSTAHFLIEALLRGSIVHFTDDLNEEFTEAEMDRYLDAVLKNKEGKTCKTEI